ncbi:MAG: hypothetical protein ACOY30_13005 [Bacillota bacterium]
MVETLCRLVSGEGWRVRHDTSGPYRGGYIVWHYSGTRGVWGVQLEISERRTPA